MPDTRPKEDGVIHRCDWSTV